MPQRNEDDFEGRRQRIIDGALHVFARLGFDGATNKDIAQAAGIVSPGLIYHYFKDKSDLLRQVAEGRIPLLQLLAHPEELMGLPPEEALMRFGESYLKVMENPEAIAVMKLIFGEAFRRPKIAKLVDEIGPSRAFRFLGEYLKSQMDAGVLKQTDPQIAARCFFGPLMIYILSREVFQQPDAQAIAPEAMLRTTIDLFLNGLKKEL